MKKFIFILIALFAISCTKEITPTFESITREDVVDIYAYNYGKVYDEPQPIDGGTISVGYDRIGKFEITNKGVVVQHDNITYKFTKTYIEVADPDYYYFAMIDGDNYFRFNFKKNEIHKYYIELKIDDIQYSGKAYKYFLQ